MIDDQYFYGPTWRIGLNRLAEARKRPLTLTIMPLRKDAPIYIDEAVRQSLPDTDQVAQGEANPRSPRLRTNHFYDQTISAFMTRLP